MSTAPKSNRTTFTPGPWRMLPWGNRGDFEILDSSSGALASVNSSDGADEPTEYPSVANALLITAAPEMYEALKEAKFAIQMALAFVGRNPTSDDYLVAADCKKRVEAALAKAEGK